MHEILTSAHNSSYSASPSTSSDAGPKPASSAAAKASAPRTELSTSRFLVLRSCRVATVYAQVMNLERPSKEPRLVTMRTRTS